MGKLTISMAIFNSYVKLPEGMMNYSELAKKRLQATYPTNGGPR